MIERIVAPPLGANVYLILDEKRAVIDVGGDPVFLIGKLKDYIKPRDLDYIILTHSHFDHASATADVKKACSAKVLIHREEYEFVKKQGFSSLLGFKFPPFEADYLLNGGEIIDLGEIELKVIHTPGHSPGSICLYDKRKKMLFSGDTVFPNGSFGRVDFPGGSPFELINSLKKLSELDVYELFPGHETPVKNANEHIRTSYKIARSFL